MNWRDSQLGAEALCDQDQLILKLFQGQSVNYQGNDFKFAKHLDVDYKSSNLILILNRPLWLSEIVNLCNQHFNSTVSNFYVGINRYLVIGNDIAAPIACTNCHGQDIINFVTLVLQDLGFSVSRSGTLDHDRGRYFNFVQPVTWVYGSNNTNTNN